MTSHVQEMIDILFDLGGETPHASYPFALWEEILRLAPQLAEQRQTGILPLRLPASSEGTQLQKRAKLALRLAEDTAEQITALLSGQQIELDGSRLQLGKGKKRTLLPYPTVHAHMVAGVPDEVMFMEDISAELKELGVSGNLICGRRHTLAGDRQSIAGFSLVIHDLKPEASLRLQYAGLGTARHFGCGIFIPYKVISGLDDH